MTGLKLPITTFSYMGHCTDYKKIVKLKQRFHKSFSKTVYHPHKKKKKKTAEPLILSFFWADNFNQILESLTKHVVINSRHIVEFFQPLMD